MGEGRKGKGSQLCPMSKIKVMSLEPKHEIARDASDQLPDTETKSKYSISKSQSCLSAITRKPSHLRQLMPRSTFSPRSTATIVSHKPSMPDPDQTAHQDNHAS